MQVNLTNSESKLIKSLQQKKYRDAEGLFIAEGVKLVREALVLPGVVQKVVYTGQEADFGYGLPPDAARVSPSELERISSQKSPNRILAVCRKATAPAHIDFRSAVFALDGVADPGNMGTILRTLDWFGYAQLICSPDCADIYNPKVVQASMGSIFRVAVAVMDLELLPGQLPPGCALFGADMGGVSVYTAEIGHPCVLVMGSEANGIRPSLRNRLTGTLSIPRFGKGESLNVAIATALIAAELKRRDPR